MTGSSLIAAALLVGAPPAASHFDTEIVPVFTKAGCNAGACHGAAAGRGGFHLSLFGGDPAADYDAIVHALEGRRVNLARPTDSLVIAKPTGNLKHGGGDVLDLDGAGQLVGADRVHVAAACAHAATLRELLAEDLSRANADGGPFGWPPLLYLAYARHDPHVSADAVRDSVTALVEA